MAEKIAQRIGEIISAPDIAFLVRFHVGNCHPLKGNRKGEFAVDLIQPYRMIFIEINEKVHLVRITSIEDYH
jgi:proteic killer suppression protein